jgi:hypothetical protein
MAEDMRTMPDPLTPEDCDLRDYTFMPLDIVRLFGSEFHAQSTDSEWRAGVTLWCKSFHQMPAASLPDDDVTLCRLAELGRDIKTWKKLREGALRGWVKCSDGRLYHKIVAEKANDAWEKKRIQRERSRRGNEARWGKDKKENPSGHTKSSHKDSLKDSLKESHKDSLKDSLKSPLTIPRDRDRDRESNTPLTPRAGGCAPDPGQADIEAAIAAARPPTDEFDQFWAAYPRKTGKDDARKAFFKARKRVSLREIAEGLNAQLPTWPDPKSAEGRFIPHPATWLNGGRWSDDPAHSAAADRAASDRSTNFASQQQSVRDAWAGVPDIEGV